MAPVWTRSAQHASDIDGLLGTLSCVMRCNLGGRGHFAAIDEVRF